MSVKAILTEQQKSYTKAEEDALLATKVPTSRTINNKALSSNVALTAADVGALAEDGTANAAKKLYNVHAISTTAVAGWYKFLEVSMDTFTRQTLMICIESTYEQQCGILRIHTRRLSNGDPGQSIGWIAAGSKHHSVRWDYSGGVWSFYILKNSDINALVFQLLARNNDNYGTWYSTAVAEPTAATPVETLIDLQASEAISDANGDQIDTTYLKKTETAVTAGKLANVSSFAGPAGWYQFLSISIAANTRQTMVIAIESQYNSNCGILRIHTRRNSGGSPFQTIGWLASGSTHPDVRWQYSGGTWTFYAYKYADPDALYFQVLSKTADSYGTWLSTLVEEPTTATDASDMVALTAKSGLWFTSVAVSAGTSQQIIAVSDAAITTDYVLARIEWANPNYITAGYTWTTAAGSFKLTGTATAATTANVLLVRKGN